MGTTRSAATVRPGGEERGISFGITRRPAPALRPYVHRYLGHRQVGVPPGRRRLLPARFLNLLVGIGGPIDVVAPIDSTQAPGRYDVVLGGLQTAAATIAHDGEQEAVWVELTPLGSRGLLGMPAAALGNRIVEAADVIGLTAVELHERLRTTADWSERFDLVDQVLARSVDDRSGMPPEVSESWHRLVASAGATSIRELAAGTGWSRRHLAQRFRDELGHTPKLVARVIRFERVSRMLRQPNRPPLAIVAALCGYCDQSHLYREFRALAGCSPQDWIAAEAPFVRYRPAVDPSRRAAVRA
jgi:AraC-like DNA-binding protein